MNRRQFLGLSAAVTGTVLGPDALSFARRNLGVGSARAADVVRHPPRARHVEGQVHGVDGTTVTVAIESGTRRADGRLVVVRRGYPAGDVRTAVRTERGVLAGRNRVSVTLPREGAGSDPWFYEVLVTEDGERRFLCESRPYRWVDGGERLSEADRVVPPKEPTATTSFRRQLSDDEYELDFRTWDRGGELTVGYRLRRSLHEAAVARERGYVRTFEESKRNPVVRDLAESVAAAHRPDRVGPRRDDELSPSALFYRLLRFAQAIEYVRDFESTDRYDYVRTPEETLVDGVGDCKDKSNLLAGLLAAPPLDCETALLYQPAHVLLGVAADDVPPDYEDVETVTLDGREFLPLDPSLWFDVGDYPDAPITAAYGRDGWFHVDVEALGRGAERNVRDWLANGLR